MVSAFAVLASSSVAPAQQFVTDDAAVVDFRACQLEAWHGLTSSWILPACHLVRGAEITAGVAFVDQDSAGRQTEYLLQVKTLLREAQPHHPGVGLAIGIGMDRRGPADAARVASAYAYLPVSLALEGDRIVLHANAGWRAVRLDPDSGDSAALGHDDIEHAFTWALRGDLVLSSRWSVIGETFGQDRALPHYQIGLRTSLVPERLQVDVSFGGHLASGEAGTGWVIGVAWTPRPFSWSRAFSS